MKIGRMRRAVPRDYKSIASWYTARGQEAPPEYPPVCVIMPQVASGGLIPTQGSICLIEGLITNPRASKQVRSDGLDKIIKHLTEYAKNMGFSYIVGLTKVPHVVSLSEKHGFSKIGDYTMVSKHLSTKESA